MVAGVICIMLCNDCYRNVYANFLGKLVCTFMILMQS